MNYTETLEITSNVTGLLTFGGGVGAWCYYQYGIVRKRKALEKCLREDGRDYKKAGQPGAFTALHITARTGLTESEILQGSFKNPRINRLERTDAAGYTEQILFQYNG